MSKLNKYRKIVLKLLKEIQLIITKKITYKNKNNRIKMLCLMKRKEQNKENQYHKLMKIVVKLVIT